MTVYNINLGIGWASSGVEYAQAYRAQLLRRIQQPAKFIFMDMILADNIQHLTENIGFLDEEVIWLYNYFTDIKIAPTMVTLDQVLAQVAGQPERSEREGKIVRYFYPQDDQFITCYLRQEDQDFVEHVEYVSRGRLIRKDYFSYVRYGNQTFIDDGKNGYLIPVSSNQVEDQIIAAFVEKIVALFSQGRQQEMSQHSYQVAENYLTSRVEAAWSQLLKEVRDDSAL